MKSFHTPDHFHAHLDNAGVTASTLCAIHCALMPMVVTLLPLLGLSFLADEKIEWLLLALAALLGTSSLCLGYRVHGSRRVFGVFGAGLMLLVVGRLAEHNQIGASGVGMVVIGGLIVAASHLLNRRLCHACKSCQLHHKQEEK